MGLRNPISTNIYQTQVPYDTAWRQGWYVPLVGAGTNGIGFAVTGGGGSANVAATASNLQGRAFTAATTLNNINAQESDANLFCISNQLQASAVLSLDATASRRVMFGFGDAAVATMLASDTPAQNYFVLRYSTGASDATWKACSDNGSGTPLVVASGVAPSTATIWVSMIVKSPTSVVCYINGQSFANLTTKLPATSVTSLRFFFGITNLTAGTTRTLNIFNATFRAKYP